MASYQKIDLNFWLSTWKNYYQYVNNEHPENSLFVSHQELCANPEQVLTSLFSILDVQASNISAQSFLPPVKEIENYDPDLLKECNEIYKSLEEKFYGWYQHVPQSI